MNKPELTHEVALFLATWTEYQAAIQGHRFTDLERYGRNDYAGIINHNAEVMDSNAEKMEAIRAIGDRLAAMGADTMAAAQQYQNDLYTYEREQREEAERPRREWEEARREYLASVQATIRSLKIKVGRAESKVYNVPDEERAAARARVSELRAELALAEQLENGTGSMRYNDGDLFTEQAVLDSMEARRQNWAYIMEQLAGQPA